MDQDTLKVILFFNSSLASTIAKTKKKYLIAVFKHWLWSCTEFLSEHFAEKMRDCDVRLQSHGTINFLQFFWTTLYIIFTPYSKLTL